MCQRKEIDSIESLIKETKNDYQKWGLGESPCFPWFRGEPDCDTPLVPRLYRKIHKDDYFENRLLQNFRTRAMGYGKTPRRDEPDLLLFLAQHVGLPTRLLDWTESSLVSLYFALSGAKEAKPVVWMLNPFALNQIAIGGDPNELVYNIHALTWYNPEGGKNIGSANINAAWQVDQGGIDMPAAIPPTYIHARMGAQRCQFTVHGNRKESLCALLSEHASAKNILKQYIIDTSKSKEMIDELRILGVSRATLFPDLDSLAADLTKLFRPDLVANGPAGKFADKQTEEPTEKPTKKPIK
jgi:hypothetical protein